MPARNIQITEITTGARGAWFLFPETTCILDIGSQSSRAIRVGEKGRVKEFKTNEKCASGSGGFLEKAAKYLEITVDEMGTLFAYLLGPPGDLQRLRGARRIGDHQPMFRTAIK